MPDVTLGGNLPNSAETNGLIDWAEVLLREAADITLCAVVAFEVSKIVETVHDGTRRPTLRLAWIEPLGRVGDVPEDVRQLVAEARAQRTGSEMIPFDEVTPSGEVYSTGPDDDPARTNRKTTKKKLAEPAFDILLDDESTF